MRFLHDTTLRVAFITAVQKKYELCDVVVTVCKIEPALYCGEESHCVLIKEKISADLIGSLKAAVMAFTR